MFSFLPRFFFPSIPPEFVFTMFSSCVFDQWRRNNHTEVSSTGTHNDVNLVFHDQHASEFFLQSEPIRALSSLLNNFMLHSIITSLEFRLVGMSNMHDNSWGFM